MDRLQALRTLTELRNELQREYKTFQAAGTADMRPSELAMTLASLAMRISALQFAISELEHM